MTYLEMKKQLLLGYLSISEEIVEKLQEEDYEALQEGLSRRDQIIHKINEMDQKVSSEVMKEGIIHLSPLLQDMIKFDESIQKQLTEKKDMLHGEIKKMNALKKANQLYQNRGYSSDGLFFDQTIRLK